MVTPRIVAFLSIRDIQSSNVHSGRRKYGPWPSKMVAYLSRKAGRQVLGTIQKGTTVILYTGQGQLLPDTSSSRPLHLGLWTSKIVLHSKEPTTSTKLAKHNVSTVRTTQSNDFLRMYPEQTIEKRERLTKHTETEINRVGTNIENEATQKR